MFDLNVGLKDVNGTLGHLETTLHSWLHVVREYTHRVPKDLMNPDNMDYAWWSRERSQVGFLAFAAWLNGWAVLEEWGMEIGSASGRNDLWIGRRDIEFYIEAKQGSCFIDKDAKSVEEQIRTLCAKARDSAGQLPAKFQGKRIAAVFITPSWQRVDDSGFDEMREVWKNKVSAASNAVALITPSWDECAKGKDGYRYVGAALLLEAI